MTDNKREEVQARIDLAQARNDGRRAYTFAEKLEDQAIEAKDKFVSFAKDHPVATMAGGLAVGVLVAAMFKGPRRAARSGGARAAGLAAIGSEIALAFASQLLDGAQDAGRSGVRRLDALGETLGQNTRNLRRGAAHRAGDAADAAQAARHNLARRIKRVFERR